MVRVHPEIRHGDHSPSLLQVPFHIMGCAVVMKGGNNSPIPGFLVSAQPELALTLQCSSIGELCITMMKEEPPTPAVDIPMVPMVRVGQQWQQ